MTLPWKKKTRVSKDLGEAQKILDQDHWGLEKVNEYASTAVVATTLTRARETVTRVVIREAIDERSVWRRCQVKDGSRLAYCNRHLSPVGRVKRTFNERLTHLTNR